MTDELTRSAKITIEVLGGMETLQRGQETARQLWNHLWWCGVGFNRKYQRRGKWLGMKHKEKWPGRFGLDAAFRDYWAAIELSDRCYSTVVQEFDIAMRSWFSNLKSNPRARPPRYCPESRPLFFEVGRNAKPLGDWRYRLTVLGGHIEDRHAVVKLRIAPGIKMKDIKIIRVQPDFSGTVVYYQEPKARPGDRVAGLDLGVNNLGILAFDTGESILYSGRGVLSSDRRYHQKEARCKPKGWQGKGQAESRQSGRKIAYRVKAGNKRRLAVHNFTRSVIGECIKRGVGTLATGDLKHIRQGKDFGKAGNQKLHAWPFAEILRQLKYKGEEAGIEVVTVSERHTSQTCHVCGTIDRSSRVCRGLYKCQHCSAVLNADLNGAFNILNRLYGYLVSQAQNTSNKLIQCKIELSETFDNKERRKIERKIANLSRELDKTNELLTKVSPVPVGAGVGALLPCPPSLPATAEGTGEAPQIHPSFVAKFDLRNWAVAVQGGCNMGSGCGGMAHERL